MAVLAARLTLAAPLFAAEATELPGVPAWYAETVAQLGPNPRRLREEGERRLATAKALNVTGLAAIATRAYDTTATAGLTGTPALLALETVGTGSTTDGTPYTGDTITLADTAAGTFTSEAVGTAKAITVTGLSLTGADNADYTVTHPTNLAADVTAIGLTVSGVTANNKIYDGSLVAALNLGTAALVGVLPGDTVTIGTGNVAGAFANKTIGTAKPVTVAGITISGTDSGNYALTQPSTTANITPKALTVSAIAVPVRVYEATPVAVPNYTNAALNGVVPGDTVTFVSSGGTANFANKNVAPFKSATFAGLTLAGADAGNYTLTQPTTSASISAAGVAISITNLSFTYDGTTKSATISIIPNAASSIVYSGGGSGPINAGSYTVSVNVTDNNYSGSSTATLTIAKAAQTLAFTIDPGANFSVGSSHALAATASSALPVTFSVVSGSASLSGSRVTVTQVGAVTLRATQAGDSNYNAASADQGFTGVAAT